MKNWKLSIPEWQTIFTSEHSTSHLITLNTKRRIATNVAARLRFQSGSVPRISIQTGGRSTLRQSLSALIQRLGGLYLCWLWCVYQEKEFRIARGEFVLCPMRNVVNKAHTIFVFLILMDKLADWSKPALYTGTYSRLNVYVKKWNFSWINYSCLSS